MDPPIHILLDAVVDDRVMAQTMVARMIVRIDGLTRRGVARDEPESGRAVRAADRLGGHGIRVAVLHPDDGGFPHDPPPGPGLLVGVFIFLLTSSVKPTACSFHVSRMRVPSATPSFA